MSAEEAVTKREAEVTRASTGDHTLMAAACRALEEAQKEVERLYHRWQELEAKRGG
jgi:ATP-binding cassette subfamily F protein uup